MRPSMCMRFLLRLGNRWAVRRTCAIAAMATGPENRAHNIREKRSRFCYSRK